MVKYYINDDFKSAPKSEKLQHVIEALNNPETFQGVDSEESQTFGLFKTHQLLHVSAPVANNIEHVQGVDLGIAVDGQSTAQKRPGFSKFHGGETITTEAFSYTEFRNKTRTRVTGTMLFDLAEDPNENLNISDFSDAASIKAKLSSRLDSLRKVAFE